MYIWIVTTECSASMLDLQLDLLNLQRWPHPENRWPVAGLQVPAHGDGSWARPLHLDQVFWGEWLKKLTSID